MPDNVKKVKTLTLKWKSSPFRSSVMSIHCYLIDISNKVDFIRNYPGRTHMYEFTLPPPITAIVSPLIISKISYRNLELNSLVRGFMRANLINNLTRSYFHGI